MRNCLVREESDCLVLGSGIPASWIESGHSISIGPAPTPFGPIEVVFEPTRSGKRRPSVHWAGQWRGQAPTIEVRVPGFAPALAAPGQGALTLED